MTLFGSRPRLEFGDVSSLRDTPTTSTGQRIRITECTYSMIRSMKVCADLVESIEDKRLNNERRIKGVSKLGKADPAAEELFDQIVASGKEIVVTLKKMKQGEWSEPCLLYSGPNGIERNADAE
jgi:hypothetical protein